MKRMQELLETKLIRLNEVSLKIFGVGILGLKILTNLRGTRAGVINTTSETVRLNGDLFKKYPEFITDEVLIHEVAHYVTNKLYGYVKPHGVQWKMVASRLGIPNPKATHSMPVSKAKEYRRIRYVCDCSSHMLTAIRHNRILNGQSEYYCRKCRGKLKNSGCLDESI